MGGGLVLPGPQTGSRRPPLPKARGGIPPFREWFPAFVREELQPYPGRGLLTLRYVLAATITMLLIMTFRIPGAAVGGFFSLLLPRDSPLTTARSAATIFKAFGLALSFALLGAMLLVDYPITHLVWVVSSFFLGFYALSALSNYAAASAFTILIVLAVPAWDATRPTSDLVTANLWVAGSVAVATSVTLAVEYAFALFDTKDQLEEGLKERLSAVHDLLLRNPGSEAGAEAMRRVQRLAMVGVSRLRRLALSGPVAVTEAARRSTTVALVGRLVDLAASGDEIEGFTPEQRPRLRALARQIAEARSKLRECKTPPAEAVQRSADDWPLLLELERTTELLQLSLTPNPGRPLRVDTVNPPDPPFFKPDAWSNPDHLSFALRGCFATVVCYSIENALSFPGLSTALFTCVVTALTSIGTSRQKQLLRISGALVGGLLFGIGTQVLILPMLDTIAGFTVMFALVTAIASWFITASPRLSYFGAQLGLAFFLVHLSTPHPQTNLTVARNNVLGILLGLSVMWLVFEKLGAKPAVQVMEDLFAANLRLMARLAQPWAHGRPANVKEIRALREKVTQNFGAINAQADAVLFELGSMRPRSLAVRNRLLSWQPRLRALFLLQIALLQYRVRIAPAKLSPAIQTATQQFDDELSARLRAMAQAFERHPSGAPAGDMQHAFAMLQSAIDSTYEGKPTPRARAVLSLSSHLVEGSTSLAREVQNAML